MVTCTAIASAILQYTRHGHARQCAAEAKNIVAEDVGQHESPLPVLEVSHGFKSIARESSKRAAEADHYQQPPARVYKCPLRGPDDEQAHDEAAHNVDKERSVREDGAQFQGSEAAQQVTQVGADDGGDR